MDKKQRLRQELYELLVKKKNLEKEQNTSGDNGNPNSKSNGKSYGGKQLSLGSHPGVGKFFSHSNENDDIPTKNGFSNILMLSFLTLFFEITFLVISYFIFT